MSIPPSSGAFGPTGTLETNRTTRVKYEYGYYSFRRPQNKNINNGTGSKPFYAKQYIPHSRQPAMTINKMHSAVGVGQINNNEAYSG